MSITFTSNMAITPWAPTIATAIDVNPCAWGHSWESGIQTHSGKMVTRPRQMDWLMRFVGVTEFEASTLSLVASKKAPCSARVRDVLAYALMTAV